MLKVADLYASLDAEELAALFPYGSYVLINRIGAEDEDFVQQRRNLERFVSGERLLLDSHARRILLGKLSRDQAVSLLDYVKREPGVDPFTELERFADAPTSEELDSLLSWFGLTRPDVPQAEQEYDPVASVESVEPSHALYDYQRQALEEIKAIFARNSRAVLHMPTGSGKTRTAMALAADHLRQKEDALVVWLADTLELCRQAREEFKETWYCVGNQTVSLYSYMEGIKPDLKAIQSGFLVMTLGAAAAALRAEINKGIESISALAMKRPLVIFDEAHKATANKFGRVFQTLARLMMFKEFFTRNLCFVHIVCSTTEALDIFQTINTAGKPLSCIETFLPEGYRFVARNDLEALAQKQTIPGVGTWMGHSLEELMEMINDLSALITELKLSVPEIVTTFAFVYEGTKLGKNLIDQRQYLTNGLRGAVKKAQSNAKGKAPQEELLKPIYQYFLVLYLTIKWRLYLEWEKRVNPASASPKNSAQQRLDELFNAGPSLADDVELQFALGVIRESNLSLPLSVMCRYFIKWQIDGKPESAKDMTQASKALLSFAALWLSGSKGTSGIDQAFRDFMCSKDKNQKQAKAQGASVALCSDAQLNVEMLRNHLFERYCEKKNNNKSLKGWISALKSAAVAKDRVAIARFLQMLYLENSEEDPKSPIGVRKSVSRPQSAGQTLLSPTGWRSVRALELEHILPQKPKDPWDKLLKNCEGDDDKVRRINQLGNVMYLPKTINIIVGNRPWNQKKMFYMALADNSGKAVDNLRARQQQLQLSMDDIDNLEEKKKLINNYGRSEWPKGYDSLAQWKEYTIDNRTAAIAEILWPHLCAWLGVDANQLGATAQTQSQPNPQAAPASANGTGTTPNKKQKGEAAPENQPAPAQVANQPAQKRGIDRLMAAAEKLVSSILGQGQTDGDKIEWIVQKSQARLSAGEQGIELFLSGLDGFRIRDNRNHQLLKDGHKLTYKTRNAFNEGEGALKKVLKRWLKKIVPGTRV